MEGKCIHEENILEEGERFEKDMDRETDEIYSEYKRHIAALTGRSRDCGVLLFTILTLLLCLVFFLFCPKCMFGILALSACLCPFYNSMNAPLWLAIILLTLSGWSFTSGSFQVSWIAHA